MTAVKNDFLIIVNPFKVLCAMLYLEGTRSVAKVTLA
jgi:hypothetical protein